MCKSCDVTQKQLLEQLPYFKKIDCLKRISTIVQEMLLLFPQYVRLIQPFTNLNVYPSFKVKYAINGSGLIKKIVN